MGPASPQVGKGYPAKYLREKEEEEEEEKRFPLDDLQFSSSSVQKGKTKSKHKSLWL